MRMRKHENWGAWGGTVSARNEETRRTFFPPFRAHRSDSYTEKWSERNRPLRDAQGSTMQAAMRQTGGIVCGGRCQHVRPVVASSTHVARRRAPGFNSKTRKTRELTGSPLQRGIRASPRCYRPGLCPNRCCCLFLQSIAATGCALPNCSN